jgi:5-oxoprolinase (ATP-hydrolysing)
MNNFLFGNALPVLRDDLRRRRRRAGFAGASAVHSHMTNTRITDPEILEQRYPVRLDRFDDPPRIGGSAPSRRRRRHSRRSPRWSR